MSIVGKLLQTEKAMGRVATIEGRPNAFATKQVDLRIWSIFMMFIPQQVQLLSEVLKWTFSKNYDEWASDMESKRAINIIQACWVELGAERIISSTVFCFRGFARFALIALSNKTTKNSEKTDAITLHFITLTLKGMDYVPPFNDTSEVVVSFL